ncbi:MAG: glycosyltransferase family 4 protein [Blastocatellales bacterium]
MKVVYLNPTGQPGGAERVLLDMMASLLAADSHFFPHLIAASDGPLVAEARKLGVTVTILPFPPSLARLGDGGAGGPAGRQIGPLAMLGRLTKAGGAAGLYLNQLRRTLKRLSPDLIHTNGFKMHLLGLWARPRQTPVVWHIHDYISARPLMARVLPRFANRCTAIIAVSDSVAADVRKLCRAPVHTIHNAVDLDRFSPSGEQLDLDKLAGMLPAPDGTVRVAMFATMARWKGHEIFLQALAALPDELPIRAYIVGNALYQTDGSQYSLLELRRMAKDLGVSHKVGFTGFVENVPAAMRACDIIVHASTQPEPFGLVIIEAMACGKPVIVSNSGGAAELIEDGRNALTHQPGNVQGLMMRLNELVISKELRQNLGIAGNQTAKLRFSSMRLGHEILTSYRTTATDSTLLCVNEPTVSV